MRKLPRRRRAERVFGFGCSTSGGGPGGSGGDGGRGVRARLAAAGGEQPHAARPGARSLFTWLARAPLNLLAV